MKRTVLSTSSNHTEAQKRRNPAGWLIILGMLAIISLSCKSVVGGLPEKKDPARPVEKVDPAEKKVKQVGFEKTDCSLAGVSFTDITINNYNDDIYDGPYLICSASSTGSHGLSENYYYNITAYKPEKLAEAYQNLQTNIQGHVDQAQEWNAQPDVPAEVKNEITFIRNDSDGYVFMITSEANVQGCQRGSGYGAEKVNGRYLVQLSLQSCELPDAAAYSAAMKSLETAALAAITRVKAASEP